MIVESFERIHRSNLVGMGVLPLQFNEGTSHHTLTLTIHCPDVSSERVPMLCRIDTADEVAYYKNGASCTTSCAT